MTDTERPPLPTDINCRESSLDNDYWAFRWKHGYTGWHESSGNRLMWKYMNDHHLKLLADRNPADVKVFVPLCGKSVDMKLMYDLGFTVVGVEYSGEAIEKFFAENSIPVESDSSSAGAGDKDYTVSEDGRIQIGKGDLFTFTAENLPFSKFDIIWDRGSFEAINHADRQKYADLLASLLADDGILITSTKDYDTSLYGGPPLAADKEELMKYFGKKLSSCEEVGKEDMLYPEGPHNQKWRNRGITTYMYELVHVIRI